MIGLTLAFTKTLTTGFCVGARFRARADQRSVHKFSQQHPAFSTRKLVSDFALGTFRNRTWFTQKSDNFFSAQTLLEIGRGRSNLYHAYSSDNSAMLDAGLRRNICDGD